MTILESHRILIGACGWLHDNWQQSFYPEDLPQDWYLGYYGNEYPVVMISEKEWQQGGEVEEWLAETDALPVFICELPLTNGDTDLLNNAERYLKAAGQLGERCIGIVCRVDNTVNAEQLKQLLQQCQAIAPTVLAMDDIPADIQAVINELAVNPLWSSGDSSEDNQGSLYIARLDSSSITLPVLRATMENLLQRQTADHTLVLLIDGDAPDLEIIKQAKVMLDLL